MNDISSSELTQILAEKDNHIVNKLLALMNRDEEVGKLSDKKLFELANAGMLKYTKEGTHIFSCILDDNIEYFIDDLDESDMLELKQMKPQDIVKMAKSSK